jgi:hypothetical protein
MRRKNSYGVLDSWSLRFQKSQSKKRTIKQRRSLILLWIRVAPYLLFCGPQGSIPQQSSERGCTEFFRRETGHRQGCRGGNPTLQHVCVQYKCVSMQALAWMAQRSDIEVMRQREAIMLAIEQLTAEMDANGQKRAW